MEGLAAFPGLCHCLAHMNKNIMPKAVAVQCGQLCPCPFWCTKHFKIKAVSSVTWPGDRNSSSLYKLLIVLFLCPLSSCKSDSNVGEK